MLSRSSVEARINPMAIPLAVLPAIAENQRAALLPIGRSQDLCQGRSMSRPRSFRLSGTVLLGQELPSGVLACG